MPRQAALGQTQNFLPIMCMGLIAFSLCGCSSVSQAVSLSPTPHVNTVSPPEPADGLPKTVRKVEDIQISSAQSTEIGLKTGVAKTGFIYQTVESPGRVTPNAESTTAVSTPSPGRVQEVRARLGEVVQLGQIMAVIKSDAIGQVQSDLLQSSMQSKADIKLQQVQLKLSHITFDRENRLFNEQVSAKADLLAAQNQLEKDDQNMIALKNKLNATFVIAQARLTLLGTGPDSAQKVLREQKIDPWVVIRAPRGGLVIERNINPGEMSDGSKPLFTLANLSQVWLVGDIFEKDIESVRKGQQASVSVDSLPGHSFPAKIIWIGDTLSATTRSLPVRADVANPQQLLKPGMFARMTIKVSATKVLQVPRSAVVQNGDEELVFVEKKEGVFSQRQVTTGLTDSDSIEIKSGLSAGERIAVNGATALLGASMKSLEGS